MVYRILVITLGILVILKIGMIIFLFYKNIKNLWKANRYRIIYYKCNDHSFVMCNLFLISLVYLELCFLFPGYKYLNICNYLKFTIVLLYDGILFSFNKYKYYSDMQFKKKSK